MSERIYLVDDPAIRAQLVEKTFAVIPHTRALGMEFVALDRNQATGKLPYRENLVGNVENGALHTGVLISMFDSIAGLAVLCALPAFEMFATLDLRIDCFKPSTAGLDLFGFAECYRLTNSVAFVKGCIYHASPEHPIAACVATFYRSGKRNRIQQKADKPTPTTESRQNKAARNDE